MPSTEPPASPAVDIEKLCRRFGTYTALDRVDLQVAAGEFFSLLGPSGCGKTTLLRLIAGLDLPDAGGLRIGGIDMAGVPAHRRPVNTVFQSYALFPHLTVRENISFGLRMKKVPAAETSARVQRVMELVEIVSLAERMPSELSGGQKQRVALARALVNEPQVLLLDEPLGALDLKLRRQLQEELRHLQRRLGVTFIYVTHDQEEALRMSDRIAVMNSGKIEQLGSGRNLYERPRNRFVAQFLGAANLFDATMQSRTGQGLTVEIESGNLNVDLPVEGIDFAGREKITLAIRPEKIALRAPGGPPGENEFSARIEEIIFSGAETQYVLRLGTKTIIASAASGGTAAVSLSLGSEAIVALPRDQLILLED